MSSVTSQAVIPDFVTKCSGPQSDFFSVLSVYAPENFSRVCVGMLVCEWKV